MTRDHEADPLPMPERREGLYINSIVIPADGDQSLRQQELPTHGLDEMQALVNGLIQGVNLGSPPARLYSNEDGKSMKLPPNKRATLLLWLHNPAFRYQDLIVGDAFIVGPEQRSADSSVPDEYVRTLLEATSFNVELQLPGSEDWQRHPQLFDDWVTAYENAIGWSGALPRHVLPVRVVPTG